MENESSGCRPEAVNQSLQLSDVSSLLIFPKTPVSGEGLKRHELLQAGFVCDKIFIFLHQRPPGKMHGGCSSS